MPATKKRAKKRASSIPPEMQPSPVAAVVLTDLAALADRMHAIATDPDLSEDDQLVIATGLLRLLCSTRKTAGVTDGDGNRVRPIPLVARVSNARLALLRDQVARGRTVRDLGRLLGVTPLAIDLLLSASKYRRKTPAVTGGDASETGSAA